MKRPHAHLKDVARTIDSSASSCARVAREKNVPFREVFDADREAGKKGNAG